MRSDRFLTTPRQFENVHTHGRSLADGPVLIRSVRNDLQFSRFGLSVGRRVGKAVTRNRVKRRLRAIMNGKQLVPGWDIVIIGRASAAQSSYATIDGSVTKVLTRGGLLVVDAAGAAPGGVNLA